MCTVVFLPQKTGCCFASLRDESPNRTPASNPVLMGQDSIQILAPIDPLGKGTWIGANSLGNVIILLNGAFQNHQRKPAYRKSRGLIVSELLTKTMPVIEWSLMDMSGIEPYTIIVWSEGSLFRLVWDGDNGHRIKLDHQIPHIFSSATLYDDDAKQKRSDLFQTWMLMNPSISKQSVFDFFESYSEPYNGFIMNRNEQIKTLSYSYINIEMLKSVSFSYWDLEVDTQCVNDLVINPVDNLHLCQVDL